jgi:hypothetical protein
MEKNFAVLIEIQTHVPRCFNQDQINKSSDVEYEARKK